MLRRTNQRCRRHATDRVSARCVDREAQRGCGSGHPLVIGHDRSQVCHDEERRREVDRVEAAQDRPWRQRRGSVEERRVEGDLVHACELTASLRHGRSPTRLDGPYDLDPGEGAGDPVVGPVPT